MKIAKSKFYSLLLIILLLSQIYIPSFKFNVFLQIFFLGCYIFLEKPKISTVFLKKALPLFIIFLIGFLGALFYNRPFGFILKDAFHFIKPLVGFLLGYFLFKSIGQNEILYRGIIKAALISALIHLIIILFFTNFWTGSISSIREHTKGNYLELISVFILWFYPIISKREITFYSKKTIKAAKILILVSCVFYFSRTMMVGAIVFLLSIYGYTKLNIRSLKTFLYFAGFILFFYMYLYNVKLDKNQNGLESFLYKIKIAPEELFKTKIDRKNHKDLWDHWRGYEAKRAFVLINEKPLHYFTGTGYGSLVNLKFKAPLGKKGMKYISELHNGYVYIFYKVGIFGLLLYLYFLGSLYRQIYLEYNFESILISAIGLFYLFSTLTISGIYNVGDPLIFILGGLMYLKIKAR